MLNQTSFAALCEVAAGILGSDDPVAAGRGEQFFADGIACQFHNRAARGSIVVLFDLGDPDPDSELQLYRELLAIQTQFAGNMECMFVRDPISELLCFSLCLPLADDWDGTRLGESLRPFLAQVRTWRETLLKGLFVDYDRMARDIVAGRQDEAAVVEVRV